MNLANKITVFRVILIPVFLVVYISEWIVMPWRNIAAVTIFIVASFTDFLDGYIARSRNLVTNFGKFADPLADKLLVCAAMVAAVEKNLLPSWVVILILSREFIIMGFRTVAASENIIIAASMWGKVKTNFQFVLLVYVMLELKGGIFDPIMTFLVGATVVLTVISAWDYIYKNKSILMR